MPDPALVLEASVKAVLYASLLAAIGASTVRWLLLRRVMAELGASRAVIIEQSVARVALAAALFALAAAGVRVWTHTVSAFGFDGAGSWDTLKLIALHSRWAQGWKPQVIAAVMLTTASVATVWRRTFWPLSTIAAVVFTATMPLLGHAAGDAAHMAVDIFHILGAGVWLGTLAVVVLIPVPAKRIRLLILRHFSPVALSGAATAIAAGLVAAWLYVGAYSNLWTTAYGRILVLKSGLVAAISICGYVNWRRLRRLHRDSEPSASIVVLEAALTAAVVIVTGYLTETGHP